MKYFQSINKYDCFLMLLVSLLIFGNIGNGAQPIRLLTLAVAPIMFIEAFKKEHQSIHYYKYECFFLVGWWLWAIAFFFMAINPSESAKHLVYLAIHILAFLEVLWAASKAKNPQVSVRNGWLLMLACSIPIAVNEFLTDTHLATSLWDSGSTLAIDGVKVMRPFAAVSFGNLNTYNTVLCWTLPSLFFCNLFPQKKIDRLIGILLLFGTILIIIANSSRAAILCMGLMLVAFLYCYYKTGRNRILLISVIVCLVGVFAYYLIDLFILIVVRFTDQGVSDEGRTENIVGGLHALMTRGGLGIGIGNYEPVMDREYRVLYAAPHNLLLEVIVVYGIPVFVGFIGMLFRIVNKAWKGVTFNKNMLLFCLLALIFAGIIDSQYIMKAPTWIFLATMYIYLDPRYNRSTKEN